MYNRINVLLIKSKNLGIKSLRGNIMSHNVMNTFFSGTDKDTLLEQGSERDVFVSLIVNNVGKYNAAITNQVEYNIEEKVVGSGKGFGSMFNIVRNNTKTIKCVEYSYFKDIVIEKDDLCSSLENRINEINKAKLEKNVKHNNFDIFLPENEFHNNFWEQRLNGAKNNVSSEIDLFPEEKTKKKKTKVKQNGDVKRSDIKTIANYMTNLIICGNIYSFDSDEGKKGFINNICNNKKVNDGTIEDYLISIVDYALSNTTIKYMAENLGISIDGSYTNILKLQEDIAAEIINTIKMISATTNNTSVLEYLDLLIENIKFYTVQEEENYADIGID